MDYSPEDRRRAARQVIPYLTARSALGKGGQILEHAVLIQCQLNAAVELLRRLYEVTPFEEIADFLADFPVPVETKR